MWHANDNRNPSLHSLRKILDIQSFQSSISQHNRSEGNIYGIFNMSPVEFWGTSQVDDQHLVGLVFQEIQEISGTDSWGNFLLDVREFNVVDVLKFDLEYVIELTTIFNEKTHQQSRLFPPVRILSPAYTLGRDSVHNFRAIDTRIDHNIRQIRKQ